MERWTRNRSNIFGSSTLLCARMGSGKQVSLDLWQPWVVCQIYRLNILLAEYQKLDSRIELFKISLFNSNFDISTLLSDVYLMSTLVSNSFFFYTNIKVQRENKGFHIFVSSRIFLLICLFSANNSTYFLISSDYAVFEQFQHAGMCDLGIQTLTRCRI